MEGWQVARTRGQCRREQSWCRRSSGSRSERHCTLPSPADQKADLDRQVAPLATLAAENEMRVALVVPEVGNGLNGTESPIGELAAQAVGNNGL